MLTLEKLRVYESFDGDMDGWARTARPGNPHGMTDEDWFLVDELRQALHQVAAGLASPHYKAHLEERLLEVTDDAAVRERLLQLAKPHDEGDGSCRPA
jgi:hypothetical protein